MNKIQLRRGWSVRCSLSDLREWCRERLILESDWDFTWEHSNKSPEAGEVTAIIEFAHEGDALAFRLKFGL